MLASNGCSDTTVYDTVYIYDKPIANFIPKRQQFCAFDSVQFTNTSQNANAYVWYFGDGDSSNLTNPKHQYTRAGNYRVTLVALRNHPNSTVCNDTITDSIFIRPLPIPVAITNIDTNGHCSPFLLQARSNSQFAVSYSWNFGDPSSPQNTAVGSPVSHVYNNAGLYYLTLYAFNALGCVDSVKYPVKVFETPRPFFVPSNTDSCGPFVVNFNNQTQYNGPGALNYQWYVNGALISTNTQFQYTFTIPPTNTIPLSYVVRLRATSAFGCDSNYYDTITVHPNPKASFTLNVKNGCEPLNITANNTSQASTVYRWFLNGALVSTSNNYSTTLMYSPNAYQIMLIANNQYSCKPDTFMDTVRVYPKPLAAFDKSDSLLCTGAGSITFTNRSSIPQGQYRFIWSFGDGTWDSVSNNPTHFYASNGAYQVILTTISNFGCTDADTQLVRIGVPALAMFTADQVRGCDTLTVNFFNQSVNYTGVIWDLGNGTVSNKDTVRAFYSYPNSPYTVTMIALGQFGCNDTLTRNGYIQVFQKPKANFVVDDSIKFVPHRNFYFSTRSTPLPLGHLWNFGDYSTDTVYNPMFTAPDTGWIKVKLMVTTPGMCEDSIYKMIYLGLYPSALYFPNAFQPDGPFAVSRFNGVGVNLQSYHFKVYNTFGQLLFETTELDSNGSPILERGWDGKDKNGNPLPQDVYYWSAEASFYSPSVNTPSVNWNGSKTIVPNGVPRRDEKRKNKIRKDGTVTLIR
jgi:PKD repeat protein